MRRYNKPEFKVTECSVNEDILTTSNYNDLNDSTEYDAGIFGITSTNSPGIEL